MKAAAPLLLISLLAACSSRSADPAANSAQVAGNGQDFAAAVAKLPPGQQRGVFFRAVRDAGLPCQDITDVQRFPDEHGVSTWRVECDDHSQQLIEIKKDGTATVVTRPRH